MITIGFGIGVILLAGLMLTGKGRYLAKGFLNLFFTDMAKTSVGAAAIYTQAIEEHTKSYNKASDNYQKIAGVLDTARNNLISADKKIVKTKEQMEQLAKMNKFDKVQLFAEELSSAEEDKISYTNEITRYVPMFEQSKLVTEQLEAKLNKLKKDKKTVVHQLEINKQTKEMYDNLDQVKQGKSSDKLLDAVREGIIETGEMATGAKVVHDSKHSTKMLEAESEIKAAESNSYVEELRKKYQGKQ